MRDLNCYAGWLMERHMLVPLHKPPQSLSEKKIETNCNLVGLSENIVTLFHGLMHSNPQIINKKHALYSVYLPPLLS